MSARRRARARSRASRRRAREPLHPPSRGKTVRGQRTRLKLLRAAEKVFGKVGFYDARISEITRSAGVAAGTFYLYFRSKEELLRALIRQISHDLRRALSVGIAGLPTRAEAEVRGFEIFFYEFLPKHRKLYRIIKQAEFADPPIFEWYYKRLASGYARRLRQAMNEGEFRDWDEELAACALLGIADFTALRYVTWGRGLSRAKLHQLMEFILGGLAPRGAPLPPRAARSPGVATPTARLPRPAPVPVSPAALATGPERWAGAPRSRSADTLPRDEAPK